MNKYELLEIIGEGAYGIVIKARSKETNEFVAIKKFKEKDDQEEVRRCIYRELKMLKTLRASDNIVSLKEAYRKRGNIYFVFEYVDRNMLQVLEEHPRGLSQDVCKNLIYQLCKALEWCHSHDIIHRDIKPENLLISYDGKLKLCDFGFARKITNPNESGAYTEYVATRWYRPPELLLNTGYSKPVDIWAIGAILGELSDGQPLFPGDSDIDQLYQIQSMLGSLPHSQIEHLSKNPKFNGYKFPKVADSLTLRRKYNGLLSDLLIDFMEGCLELDPNKRYTIGECLQHRAFRSFLQDKSRLQSSKTISNNVKKANSFHEPNNNANLNRIIINHTQNATDHIKLKLSLNDLTAINKISNQSKFNNTNNNNNNITNSINNNRMTTSSMSVSTFSPRTTQNNSTIQFTEFSDEKSYNRSEYLNNNTNHDFNSNSESNQTLQQQKQQQMNLGLSYNNLNSNSSFLLKSKENIMDDNGAFNKFASKYNTNIAFRSSHSKSPREKKGYIYHGNTQNIDENDQVFLDRSAGTILTSRQKVQFKEESNRGGELVRVNNLSFSQNHLNTIGVNQNHPKLYRADSKADVTKLPSFKEAVIKNNKRSKTSMDTEHDDSNPLTSREISDSNMINTNANKMARSITQLNTISMTKANSQYGSKNPSIQMIQKPKDSNKMQQQYNSNNNLSNNQHTPSNAIINHFDRSLQQNTRKSCFNLINSTSFGANQNSNPTYLLALRNKK